MAESTKLTRFHKRFAELVAQGMKPTHAVRELGFKGRRPDVKGSKLMKLPQVRQAIAALDDNALENAGITRTQIVKRLGQIAFADARQLYDETGAPKPIHTLDEEAAAQIAGVEIDEVIKDEGTLAIRTTKIKRWDSVKALTELSAIAGLVKKAADPLQSVGPGLTIVVQNQSNVAVTGPAPAVVAEERKGNVVVNLPRPAR